MNALEVHEAMVKGYAAMTIFDSAKNGKYNLREKPEGLTVLVDFLGADKISRKRDFPGFLQETMEKCGIYNKKLYQILLNDHEAGPKEAFKPVKVNEKEWEVPVPKSIYLDYRKYGENFEEELYKAKADEFARKTIADDIGKKSENLGRSLDEVTKYVGEVDEKIAGMLGYNSLDDSVLAGIYDGTIKVPDDKVQEIDTLVKDAISYVNDVNLPDELKASVAFWGLAFGVKQEIGMVKTTSKRKAPIPDIGDFAGK